QAGCASYETTPPVPIRLIGKPARVDLVLLELASVVPQYPRRLRAVAAPVSSPPGFARLRHRVHRETLCFNSLMRCAAGSAQPVRTSHPPDVTVATRAVTPPSVRAVRSARVRVAATRDPRPGLLSSREKSGGCS